MEKLQEPEKSKDRTDLKPYYKSDIGSQIEETMEEIIILQSYIRSVGKRIPENILADLENLVDSHEHFDVEERMGKMLKLALSVHGDLCGVASPVTVRSLKATDPKIGFSWLKQIWAIPIIFIFTLLAFGFFIYQTTEGVYSKQPTNQTDKTESGVK